MCVAFLHNIYSKHVFLLDKYSVSYTPETRRKKCAFPDKQLLCLLISTKNGMYRQKFLSNSTTSNIIAIRSAVSRGQTDRQTQESTNRRKIPVFSDMTPQTHTKLQAFQTSSFPSYSLQSKKRTALKMEAPSSFSRVDWQPT